MSVFRACARARQNGHRVRFEKNENPPGAFRAGRVLKMSSVQLVILIWWWINPVAQIIFFTDGVYDQILGFYDFLEVFIIWVNFFQAKFFDGLILRFDCLFQKLVILINVFTAERFNGAAL